MFLVDKKSYDIYPGQVGIQAGGQSARAKGVSRAGGFSYLELVFVIGIISVLLTFAISRLWVLQVDAERVAMEQVVGALRSAIGMKFAERFVKSDLTGVRALAGGNPMEWLSEVPANYVGEREGAAGVESGNWYFDTPTRYLVYRVRNVEYFRGASGPQDHASFIVRVVSDAANGVVGARLEAVEPYSWIGK